MVTAKVMAALSLQRGSLALTRQEAGGLRKWPGENTATILSDYRRGFDWCVDLLPTYTLTTRVYALQITDTHRLVSSVYYSLH
jgi:hypothetical protein